MGEWTPAWDNDAADAEPRAGAALLYGGWAGGAFVIAAALWFLLYGTGLFTTLGSVEGTETHDRFGIRPAEQSQLGLSTMYVRAGRRLWWEYDVSVEGHGGVRLLIAKSPPNRVFIVRTRDIASTSRGRFELTAPESGFYTFSQYLIPQGDLLGTGAAGSTRYDLSWGVD